VFLIGVFGIGLMQTFNIFDKYKAKAELASYAQTLAIDLNYLQGQAVFCPSESRLNLMVLNAGEGYLLIKREEVVKKVHFAAASKISFTNISLRNINFYADGIPEQSGIFYLQHQVYPDLLVKVRVQPVTGRVKIE
jgi:hypothetical protein